MANLARTSPNPATSSAAGSRAAAGLSFQAEVFAWWAARAVSGVAPGLGLSPQVRVEAVGAETGFFVGRAPSERETRDFLRVLEVQVFDFKSEDGADFRRCAQLLPRARVSQPFCALAGIGLEAMRTRTRRQRDTLATAVEWEDHAREAPAGRSPAPDEFRSGLVTLLRKMDDRALHWGLPRHLAPGADVERMALDARLLGRVRRPQGGNGPRARGRKQAYGTAAAG
jgi:hypothetical protein